MVDSSESRRDCGRALEDVPSFRKDRIVKLLLNGGRLLVRPFLPPVSRPRLFDFLRREERILFGQRCSSGAVETAAKERGFSMRIFHQRLLAAKVLISDNEADETVSSSATSVSTLKPVLKDLEGLKDSRTSHR